ncbi:hypothetical protein [Pseudomonas syringae]|uniref:Uncharacterized protein n=1 Tax=Pseudomonas syringae TaxID=317 RepID=A0A085UNU9_PSESX|nr:hypothetical protein [Pseudomonas syringae]KFE44862.1 hypothetical protein IV02_28555 [Pseudomonas syringae]
MDADSKWKAYDLAQARLELLIGHYSEIIRDEEQNAQPDLSKIEHWERQQDAVTDQRDALRIDDEEKNLLTAQAALPLPGFSSNLPV